MGGVLFPVTGRALALPAAALAVLAFLAAAVTPLGQRLEQLQTGDTVAGASFPLPFVSNEGQTDPAVRYYARDAGMSVYFTDKSAVVTLVKGKPGQALELSFVGANPNARVEASHRAPGHVNYLVGAAANHRSNLATYRDVIYRDLWPGIDMVFKGARGQLEYEFIVAPAADPKDIRLAWSGTTGLSVDGAGGLQIGTSLGPLTDAKPQSFQRAGGRKVTVPSSFALAHRRSHSYGFEVGSYDRTRPLVIDPSLAYSTYLGSTIPAFAGNDDGRGVAVDTSGNAYVAGITNSIRFPTTMGAFDTLKTSNADTDVFVTKLSADGSSLVYSTYLGGGADDTDAGIAIDAAGSAYVTGTTKSTDFPTTAGALDTSSNGNDDAFVTKLNPSGSALAYSTYLGGVLNDRSNAIALDAGGNAYLTGFAEGGYPTTGGAFDTTNGGGDAFVTKLNASGSALTYSTYVGGTSGDVAYGIALDSAGSAYITGITGSFDYPITPGAFDPSKADTEGFVTKLNASGSALDYSSFLGGASQDEANAIAVDAAGNAYVGGLTSGLFSTTPGAYDTTYNGNPDGFVVKINASGSNLAYSTYLGSNEFDEVQGITVTEAGTAFVTGYTQGTNFPTTADRYDGTFNGGLFDVFASALSPDGSALRYSTYLGGSSDDIGRAIAMDDAGGVYLTGITSSTNYPATAGAFFDGDSTENAFVSKLQFTGTIVVRKDSIPDDPQDFSFTAGGGLSPASFSLDDDSNGTLSNTRTFASVAVGSGYSIAEATPPFPWSQTSATCDDGSPVSNINVSATETVTCTFVNRKLYEHPIGASPLRVPLVPAFKGCEAADVNASHGAPLEFGSCNPPTLASTTARLGPGSIGAVKMLVCNVGAVAPNCSQAGLVEPDLRLSANLRDVRCTGSVPAGCSAGGDYDPNSGAGPYTSVCTTAANCGSVGLAEPYCAESGSSASDCVAEADLTALAVRAGSDGGVRITDTYNGGGGDGPATVADSAFPIPIDCLATPENSSLGSICGVNTSANALVPGVVRSGDRAVWQLGEIEVFDSGPDGERGNSDDERLAVQGIYVP